MMTHAANGTCLSPIRALVVDDEPLARQIIVDLLAKRDDIVVVGECRDGESAVQATEQLAPDLLFLDIRLPALDGFATLARARSGGRPGVVFVTAFDEFAVRAFEADAVDYIVKPFTDARFFTTVDRAVARLAPLTDSTRRAYLTRVLATVGSRSISVLTDDIDWIAADSYYARLHVGGQVFLVRHSLDLFEQRLDPAKFLRVHRSAIVNVDRLREIRRDSRGRHQLVLGGGVTVPVSERRVRRVKRRLGSLDE